MDLNQQKNPTKLKSWITHMRLFLAARGGQKITFLLTLNGEVGATQKILCYFLLIMEGL